MNHLVPLELAPAKRRPPPVTKHPSAPLWASRSRVTFFSTSPTTHAPPNSAAGRCPKSSSAAITRKFAAGAGRGRSREHGGTARIYWRSKHRRIAWNFPAASERNLLRGASRRVRAHHLIVLVGVELPYIPIAEVVEQR